MTRGGRSWAEYRCRLVAEKSAQHLIGPARRVNPRVKLIVKFPNWNECHHHNGYGVAEQIAQFDAFCTGIETRDHAAHRQHIPMYTAYLLEQWQQQADAGKFHSCWVDTGSADNGRERIYLGQVYQGAMQSATLGGISPRGLPRQVVRQEHLTLRPGNEPVSKKSAVGSISDYPEQ